MTITTHRAHRPKSIGTCFSWIAAIALLAGFLSVSPALAQDGGDAGFDVTASVGTLGGYMGASNGVDNGVTQLGPVVVGSGGYVAYEVTVSASGNLSVWIDTNDFADFADESEQSFAVTAGTNHIEILIGSAAATAETFVRFIYEDGTDLVSLPNTNYVGSVNGEIEDWELQVFAAASNVTVNSNGGGTTTITRDGSLLVVEKGGESLFASVAANVNDLRIEGDNAADDLFYIDFDSVLQPGGNLIVDGNGDGGGGDEMELAYGGAGSLATLVHTFLNANDGSAAANGVTINYEDLEPITDNVPAVSRTFTFTSGADTITMTEAGGPGDDIISVDSNNSEIVTFDVSATTGITIDAGSDADIITIDDLDSAFTGATITVNGEAGADQLTLDLASDGPLAHAAVTFNGGTESDILLLESGTYASTTVDYDASDISVGAANDVSFSGLETVDLDLTMTNLQVDLTAGNDSGTLDDDGTGGNSRGQFTLGSTIVLFDTPSSAVTVNGQGGDDVVIAREIDSAYTNAVVVNGNAGSDQLRVDFGSGDPIPAGGMTYDGGSGGTNLDNLEIFGGGLAATITHAGTSATSGTVTTPEGSIGYSGVENPTEDNRTATARVFTGTGSADTITLGDDTGGPNNRASYDASTSPEVIFDLSSTTSISLNAGGGADDIDVFSTDLGYTGSVTINGQNDADHLEVRFGSGDPIPAGGFSYDGGSGGTDSDTLELSGGGTQASITHSATAAEDGTITTADGNVVYSEVEGPVQDALTATARVFTTTGAADAIVLDDEGGADDLASFDADTSPEVIFDLSVTTSITVNAGAGSDAIDVYQTDGNYAGSIQINGQDDADNLEIHFGSGDPIPTGGFTYAGGEGGTDTDTLVLDDGGTHSSITHSDLGTESGTISTDNGDVSYLEVDSGIDDDLPATDRVFTYTLGTEVIEVDDVGGTNNSKDVISSTLSQSVTYRVPGNDLTINAGSGDDTIIVNDLDNAFNDDVFVFGDGGDDIMIVDWESNSNSPLGGIGTLDFDGGSEVGGDEVRLINGLVSYVTHTYDDASSGTIEVAAGSDQMTYEDIEPIFDGLDAATRTFSFSASDDIIFLDADDYAGTFYNNLIDTASSTEGASNTSEATEFYSDDTLTSVTINGGAGSDFFDIEPSADYTVHSDGESPTTLTPGDQFTLNVDNLPGDEKITLAESTTTAGVYSFSKQGGGSSIYEDVSYEAMELVTLRFSDPNAFSADTYKGDWVYPLTGESGISVEPYFNWDIEINQALLPGHPSKYTDLQLDVSLLADLSSPVFTTNTKEDGSTLLINSAPMEDHYITDLDRDAGILLQNFTEYFWGLTATMTDGQVFCQTMRFTTIDELQPELDYPSEDLTIDDLDFEFNWNVGSPAQDAVYWRMELDNVPSGSFVGDDPVTTEGLLMGEDKNDDNTAITDGYAVETLFQSTDLAPPLAWGTTYSWRVETMWPVPPTGWVPQEIFNKNETDRLVGVSGVSQFQTITKANVPTLTYPVDALEIYTNQPKLSWNVMGPFAALTFDIQINVAGGPGVCKAGGFIGGVTGLQFDTADCDTPLIAGLTYEWYVVSSDGVMVSSPSALETFTILGNGVAAPAFPSYPVDDLEIYTTSPTFHWYTESEPMGLSFEVWYRERGAVAADCNAVQTGGTALPLASVTQQDVSGLSPGATYDWCVVTSGDNGDFDSEVATFTVAGGAGNGIPIASWPIGNATTYSLDQPLTWYVEGATLGLTGYTVEYCVAPDTFGDLGCTTVSGLTEMEYEITGLNYGDVVVWRVKASYDTPPESAWSVGSFTVTGGVNSISAELTYPVDNLIVYDRSPQFNWYVSGANLPEGALVFEVQWSYAEAFPVIGNITTTAITMETFQDAIDLIPGHTYWWRVRISVDEGSTYGAWSQVASFEIHPGAGAVMPRVGSPTRAVSVTTSTPTLSWILPTRSTSALTYDVHVGRTADLSDATVYSGIEQTHMRLENLESGQYYWAVRSHSTDGSTSAFSSAGTFVANGLFATGVETEEITGDDADSGTGEDNTVDDATTDTDDQTVSDQNDEGISRDQDASTDDEDLSIEDLTERVLPDEWALGQNYPNPFNPTTTIEFSMPLTAGVSVRVYNVLGQVVKTLVNGTLPPGIHRVSWDATDQSGASVSSGLYIYRMETEAFQATKTLVLMK